ncbi:MAG TPA: type II toxin-antitoxin system VapC family toxin [Vicinamibacteria bacterium]
MIFPDLNTIIHSYNSESPNHDRARKWWEKLMNDPAPVGLAWVVMLGFIRITTNRKILKRPLTAASACNHVRSWLAQPQVAILHPGDRHPDILFALLEKLGTAGNLTTDAHLAALAIEYQAELHTTDRDFGRFSGLRWVNPFE